MSDEVEKPEDQNDEDVQVGAPESAEDEAAPAEEAAAPAEEVAAPAEEAMDPKEVEEGKVLAIISYIIPIVALVPLIQRNNAFSLYHAKQVLILMLAGVAMGVVNVIPCIGQIICLIGALFIFVLAIMGLINAINAKVKPVPVLGGLAIKWFEGLTKQ